MFARLCATSTVAVALLVPSLALAQDPPPADAPPADPMATADVPASAAPPADATGDDAAAGDASDGRAGDPLPMAQAQRPLVLPHMVLSPSLDVGILNFSFGPLSQTVVSMGVGAKLGLGDIAEVEVSPFQSVLSPSFEYGAALGGTARFVDTEQLELGARLRTIFTTDGIGISPGMPVRLHASDMIRLDTGVHFGIITDNPLGGGDTTVGLSSFGSGPLAITPGIPLDLTVSPHELVWVGAGTGFGIFDFGNAGDSIFIPLGLNVGGTVPVDDKPMVDLGVGFGFPYFIATLPGADTIVTELWTLNFNARANLDLADMMNN